ncbi:MAG: Gfo/Idh/MocA family oxidoreductase [Hyphomicrobiales bacterium]|nr:Gfo/Idh/MocA family oxidoreductase [Hyphomicrobiales bacterium]
MGKILRWGLVGGGEGSQIGDAHRIAARIDGQISLSAGALDVDPSRGRAFAQTLGVAPDRAYGDWREMLEGERSRPDRVELVTVATPNATHFEIAAAFLENGFHVLCEKPMTMDPKDAETLLEIARRKDRVLAVNFGYSGYPMVREARAMVARGDLGRVRLAVAEFAHGFHADAADADNPRVRWRYDPAQAGVSSVVADCGIHALHMIGYVTGQRIEAISAHFASLVGDRALEDDASLSLRYSNGTIGRLWTSAVAIGQMHGLNLRIFGEKGGLRWHQEAPNQLFWTPLNQSTVVVERGMPNASDVARAASRITIGHTEGMLVAFANIYRDLHHAIGSDSPADRQLALDHIPLGIAGAEMVAAVDAAARSAGQDGAWVDLV